MRDETSLFLRYLLARSDPFRQTTCLTFTAMHPDRSHPCPSRHVPLDDEEALNEFVEDLYAANALGWGGFVGVGLRRQALGRWRRGGTDDVAALPALFVDVDDPSADSAEEACATFVRLPPASFTAAAAFMPTGGWKTRRQKSARCRRCCRV